MRIASRLIAAIALLVIIIFAAAWFTLRASLPDIDGDIEIAGLGDVATIDITRTHDLIQ